jgi:hypothetical protein
VSIKGKLESLEARIGASSQVSSSSGAREALKAHLNRIAAARRALAAGDLGAGSAEEVESEVRAVRAALERRIRELEGEGATVDG